MNQSSFAEINSNLSIGASSSNDAEHSYASIPNDVLILPRSGSECEPTTIISEPRISSERSSAAAKPKLLGSKSSSVKSMEKESSNVERSSSFSKNIQSSIQTSHQSVMKENHSNSFETELVKSLNFIDEPIDDSLADTRKTNGLPQETKLFKSNLLVTTDSLNNLKISNSHQKKVANDRMSENNAGKSKFGSKIFNGSMIQVIGKSFSKSLDILAFDSCDVNDKKSVPKTHTREITPHPQKSLRAKSQTSIENLSPAVTFSIPELHSPHSRSHSKNSNNHLSTTNITTEKNNDDGSLGDILGEGLDNILPLSTRLNANPSLSSSSKSAAQHPSINSPSHEMSHTSANVTSAEISLTGSYEDYMARESSMRPEKESSSQKSTLFSRIRSAFKRKVSKSKIKNNVSVRKEPHKLPPNFVLIPIIKAGKGETPIDPELMKSLSSSPNRYVFKGVPLPTEISYDSKRVGFNANAIDISEAIRVSELGEIPGIGKGSSAVIPVQFISNQTKILGE